MKVDVDCKERIKIAFTFLLQSYKPPTVHASTPRAPPSARCCCAHPSPRRHHVWLEHVGADGVKCVQGLGPSSDRYPTGIPGAKKKKGPVCLMKVRFIHSFIHSAGRIHHIGLVCAAASCPLPKRRH